MNLQPRAMIPKTNFRQSWIFAVLILFGGHAQIWGIEGIVTNKEGRNFEGDMQVDRSGTLQLEVQADQGSVSLTGFRQPSLAQADRRKHRSRSSQSLSHALFPSRMSENLGHQRESTHH